MDYQDILTLLHREVRPATGCTEPVAIAFAAAKARSCISGGLIELEVEVSANLIKNAAGVVIPGTREMGLSMAAALGFVCGDSSKGLNVLSGISQAHIAEAKRLVQQGLIHIKRTADPAKFFILAKLKCGNENAWVTIRDSHTNIVSICVNGVEIFSGEAASGESALFPELAGHCLDELLDACEAIPDGDLAFLQEGVDMNMRMMETGLKNGGGMNLGQCLNGLAGGDLLADNILTRIRIAVSAACDARMSGVPLPIMNTMGSGNHGIVVVIPTKLYGDHIGASPADIIRALCVGHVVTGYMKLQTGKLSPLCGCAVAAGLGAAASMATLMGGDRRAVYGAMENLAGSLAGLVCDGAKGGCALKLSVSASEAVLAAALAVSGSVINEHDGIIGRGPDETIANLGLFCRQGMSAADDVLLTVMLAKEQGS